MESDMALAAFVTLKPKPGAAKELRARVLDVAEAVRDEPGNLLTLAFADPENPDHMIMLELFRDEAAIEEHRVARSSVELGPAVHALLAEPMTIKRLVALDWPAGARGARPA
jgi:quinol monooxygenase YgiN